MNDKELYDELVAFLLTIVYDHDQMNPMNEVAISEFKAKCLALLEGVRKTHKPIRVTRFGKPVAEIHPPAPAAREAGWMGCLRESGRIEGDLIAPAGASSDWDAVPE